MSGQWLPPEEPPHRCKLPKMDYEHRDGERWRCECGATYIVVTVSEKDDTWRQFRRVDR